MRGCGNILARRFALLTQALPDCGHWIVWGT